MVDPPPPEPPECDPAPRLDCIAAGSAKLSVSEKKAGKEKLALQLKKLVDPIAQGQFGSPVTGTTRYDVCIYDGAGTLAGGVGLARAAALCGKKDKPCWKDLSGRGFQYSDRGATAGVTKLIAKAGDAGKAKTLSRRCTRARRLTRPVAGTSRRRQTKFSFPTSGI